MTTTDNELSPWLVVLQDGASSSLALWRIAERDANAVVFFSDQSSAESYAREHYSLPTQVVQPGRPELIQVLIDCYRLGVRYATLNPTETESNRVFVLRDVLQAAKESFSQVDAGP